MPQKLLPRIYSPAYPDGRVQPKVIYNPLAHHASNERDSMGSAESAFAARSPHLPSCSDVFIVSRMLENAARTSANPAGLPKELVDIIIDAAEYWPSVEVKLAKRMVIAQDADRECLRTGPLCYDTTEDSDLMRLRPYRGIHPCRKIDFSISSHDQGFGGGVNARGSYNSSYTWFDAFVVPRPDCTASGDLDEEENKRDGELQKDADKSTNEDGADRSDDRDHDDDDDNDENEDEDPGKDHLETVRFSFQNYFLPGSHTLQRNVVARRQTQHHTFSWHYLDSIEPDSQEAEEIQTSHGRGRATLDGRAVREMKVGDEITIWGRARFPNWKNTVEDMSVRVFWAI